jgi:phenylpyruvate tautomerase PptA (4-oxalocrotonate tautomerase family)
MPLVDISILTGKSPEYVKAVGDSINAAVIETMHFPADDRYQIIHQVDASQLQMQERVGDRVMMHLVMRAGRSDASKQAFYKKVVENLAANPGIPPENVLITITENHDIDWSFRDGVAQFVVSPDGQGGSPIPSQTTNTTSKTLAVQPVGQPTGILWQDYLSIGIVLALAVLVVWAMRRGDNR